MNTDSLRSEEEKRELVADVMQPPENRRRIGSAASAALYKLFCGARPDAFFDD